MLGLGNAKHVEPWRFPPGCTTKTIRPPVVVTSEEQFAALFACPSGLDFSASQVVVATLSVSPAGLGNNIVDDGTTMTFIYEQRIPCPGEPHAMPMPDDTVGFVVPAKPTRAIGNTTCNVESNC